MAECFCRWLLKVSDVATDSKGQRHRAWVVPTPTRAVRYINVLRYLLEEETSTETRKLRPSEANVDFEAAALKSREDYRKRQPQRSITPRNIRVGAELFVDYGIKYSLD